MKRIKCDECIYKYTCEHYEVNGFCWKPQPDNDTVQQYTRLSTLKKLLNLEKKLNKESA